MKLDKKYINSKEKAKNLEENSEKILISDDYYALCDVIEDLTEQLRRLTLK